MLEGALILLVGVLLGRLWFGRTRRPATDLPPSFRCSCGHEKVMHHDGGTGFCHRIIDRVLPGAPDGVTVLCDCQVYIGPEPPALIVGSFQPRIGSSRRR